MLDNDERFRAFTDLLRSYLPLAGPDPLDPSDNLVDLGLDSLNAVEILVRLEEAFDTRLPDEELGVETFVSVGSLWSVLIAAVNAGRGAPGQLTDAHGTATPAVVEIGRLA